MTPGAELVGVISPGRAGAAAGDHEQLGRAGSRAPDVLFLPRGCGLRGKSSGFGTFSPVESGRQVARSG